MFDRPTVVASGNAEIEDLGLVLARDHDVAGFEIAMDHLASVRVRHAGGDLCAIAHDRGYRKPGSDGGRQELPFDELHDDEGLAADLFDLEERAEIGMIECRRRAGFSE